MRNPKWHRDEIILALSLYFDKERGSIDSRNPKIVALSSLLKKLPINDRKPEERTFRNTNGVTLKLSNFLAIDPNYQGKGMQAYSMLDKKIFDEFKDDLTNLYNIANEIEQICNDPLIAVKISKTEDDEISLDDDVKEGQVLYKLHKVRERNKKIVEAKKKDVLKKRGTLCCEVCGFDFEKTYGEMGKGYIECHHLTPLSNFQVSKMTSIKDLALLCSNCHRIIHRCMGVSTIEEFKSKYTNILSKKL